MKYTIVKKEIWRQVYIVEASSKEEALELHNDGESELLTGRMEYENDVEGSEVITECE